MRSEPIAAGTVYFAVAFAAGFALGVVRVGILEPRLGQIAAVVVELPVILLIAWLACGWLVVRFRVPRRLGPRVVMGATAFVLLIAAELALSGLLFDRAPGEFVARLATTAGALGLAGQLAFASLPVWR